MQTKGAKILVVDDDQYISALIQQILEAEGFTVAVANNGRSALEMVAVAEPDLVLLDINMPDMTGYEVLKRIREKSSVGVMMLTGVIEPSAASSSLDLGADDYMRKPFMPRVLVARIKAKLRRLKLANDKGAD
jgi:DNA-binding response OmpR family regulator